MFVENYRRENDKSIMTGGGARPIPYPKISDEDWRVWKTFLPIRSHHFNRAAAFNLAMGFLYPSRGMPYEVATEIRRASEYFDKIEVWRKREIEKDPIAVGLQGEDRYLIARWGMDKLIPFEQIKRKMPLVLAWKYGPSALGALAGLAGVGFVVWSFLL